jgi:hypothetical protein
LYAICSKASSAVDLLLWKLSETFKLGELRLTYCRIIVVAQIVDVLIHSWRIPMHSVET